MLSRWVTRLGRRLYPPGLWEGPADRRWVALTFDDGPHPESTPRILEGLRRVEAPAAFFLIGERARKWPDVARRVQAGGHEVGNHTWGHRPLGFGTCVSPSVQVARTEELLADLCPGSPRIFRPPFGTIGPGGAAVLARQRMLPVYWSVLAGDWNPLPPREIRRRVLAAAHPGAVIVLHGGQPWHLGTAEAVEDLVRELRERDYEVVSLGTMLAAAGYEIGVR